MGEAVDVVVPAPLLWARCPSTHGGELVAAGLGRILGVRLRWSGYVELVDDLLELELTEVVDGFP